MSLYLAVLTQTFRQHFAYRVNEILSIIGNLIKVSVQVSIWIALLGTGHSDISISDMVTYTVISVIVTNIIRSEVAYTLASKVKSGSICMDLIKPIDLKTYLFAEQISGNTFRLIFTSLPILIISIIFWEFKVPKNLATFLFFLISVVLALVLMYLIDYSLGILVFWVKNGLYVDLIKESLFEIFSGATIPLWFYPDFMVSISNYLPFRLIAFEPISIYLGKSSNEACLRVILLQLLWIVVFYIIEKFLWKAAQKLVFVQGG